MAKRLTNNDVIGLVGTAASNYIQEIYDGANTHAVAVKNGITFFNGKGDTNGVVWDGVQELEVIIPTLADIVANPVTLVGVIDQASDIPGSPQNGNLVYIGTSGTYFNQVCEAGDMAVYYDDDNDGDGTWHVISGENQITINTSAGSTSGNDTVFSISGTAKTILTVEGKTLSLNIDYTDVRDKIQVVKGGATFDVTGDTVTVDSMNVYLKESTSASQNITTVMSIDLPTSLASGVVSIAENVLEASNFTFTSGSFPTATMNSASIDVTASTNIAVTGTFLTGVSGKAVGSVTLGVGTSSDNDIAFTNGIVAASGKNFVTGIRTFVSEGDNADSPSDVIFEIPGNVSVTGTSTFATGFSEASTSGDVVSSVTVGEVTIGAGSDIVTGLSGGTSNVITGVTFGTAEIDTTASWFYSGLTEGSDVVTDVTVGTVSLVSGNKTAGMTASAIVTASVSNHVLSFTTDSFMKPVDISQATSSVSKKAFTKTGVTLSGFSKTSDVLTFGGISQATTSISYKSLTTDSISIGLGSATKYVLDKEEEHAYETTTGYAKLSVTDAEFTSASPSLENKSITAYIPVNQVAVGLSGGTLPSLDIDAASGTLTGSVGTSLTTTEVSWLAVASDKATIAGGKSYTLTSDSTATGDTISTVAVAAAGTYSAQGATVTIASGKFVTAVEVSGVTVSTKA